MWQPFLSEKHYADTVADGTWPIRALYASAPQQTQDVPETNFENMPMKFLADGMRFKLSLDDEGKVSCFWNRKELDGRWVALVAAEDNCHLQSAQPHNANPSCPTVALAEMILSDCGCNSNDTALVSRVVNRIDTHLQSAQPVAPMAQQTQDRIIEPFEFTDELTDVVCRNLTSVPKGKTWAQHLGDAFVAAYRATLPVVDRSIEP